MGEDDDQILISAYSRGNLSATNEPGLTIRREIYPNSGILNMGPGDDLIRIDSYYSTSLSVSTGCVLLMGEGNDTIDLLTGGMVIHGAIDMGAGDDRFLISELSSSYTAHVQRGDYTLDPIINGGDGTDTTALPDNYYTVSTDREGTRIRNDTSSGSPGSIDVTLSSFEMITGTDLNAKAITITDGRIEIMGRSIQYV